MACVGCSTSREMSQGSQARELVELLEEDVLLGSLLSELPDNSDDIAVYYRRRESGRTVAGPSA